MVRPADDARAAEWLIREAGDFHTLHTMVPDVFEAYARVFHPAELCDREVRWEEVAAANGRSMHPVAEWGSLTGSWQLREQDGLWDREPETGRMPERLARRLASVLAEHTETPGRCWFAVWDGWGGPAERLVLFSEGTAPQERARVLRAIEEEREQEQRWHSLVLNAPAFELPSRSMRLLCGELAEIEDFYAGGREPPSLWWPEDRSWCVGGDVDLMTTYLGGTRLAIDTVLGDEELEALEIGAGASVTWEADTLNPLPGRPG